MRYFCGFNIDQRCLARKFILGILFYCKSATFLISMIIINRSFLNIASTSKQYYASAVSAGYVVGYYCAIIKCERAIKDTDTSSMISFIINRCFITHDLA